MKKTILSLIFILLTLTCFSQKVNRNLSVVGQVIHGNYNSFSINTQSFIGQDSTKITWNISPSFTIGKTQRNGVYITNQRESYLTLYLSKKWGRQRLICFGEAENSYLKKINLRGCLGLGYGYDVLRNKNVTILISEVILPEEYYSETDQSGNLFSLRSSTRVKFEYRGKINLKSITLIQPSIYSDPHVSFNDNLNMRSNNSIDIKVTQTFSITLQTNLNFSSYPVFLDKKIQKTDVLYLVGFKLTN